jgi:hypothetical protein
LELNQIVPQMPDPAKHEAGVLRLLLERDDRGSTYCDHFEFERALVPLANGQTEYVWTYCGVILTPLKHSAPYRFPRANRQAIVLNPAVGSVICFELPIPDRRLQLNNALNVDPRSLTGPRQQAKRDASYALKQATDNRQADYGWKAVDAEATFFLHRNVARDGDNLQGWLKSTRDQIAKEMGFNDSNWHWAGMLVHVVPKEDKERLNICLWKKD